MKIGVAGAGAVGSFFGGTLQKGGHDVTFLARGKNLEVLKANGLSIKGEKEEIHIDGTFTDDVAELADSDLVLFCVKSNDTGQMGRQLHSILNKDALILTLQNGVDNEEVLQEIFEPEKVLSAATYVQAFREAPGQIRQQGRVKLVIGELDPNMAERTQYLAEALHRTGVDTKYASNILEKKWRKLLWNVTFNPLSAAAGARVGEVLDSPALRQTAEAICREALGTAAAIGIKMDMDRAFSTIFSNAELAREHRTSMLQDRLQGRQMEVESMCGYIVKKASEMGVQVPTLTTIYHLLTFVNDGNPEINTIDGAPIK
ncbi:ketopantoate reductase family protein [Virgibacillus xinjiangensis]|uniref:2-dehydropantoate 2-reductase n=1 Tax=Virgibacillus xinjiangensis TaxID=393090 RepID=A0ABV7CZA9_9BACI